MATIAVLGAGSWGTALAVMLAKNGHDVTLWSIMNSEVEELNTYREQRAKLPGVILPENIKITGDLAEAAADKILLVMAVPSVFVRSTSKMLKGLIPDGQKIVVVSKGIEESTLMIMTDVIEDELPMAEAAVLSGPSHAEEAGRGIPTTCVAGAKHKETAELIQSIFNSETFRVYTSPDLLGIELGGSLKNVVALAAGIADGLGYGDNTKAALITRGITEISRLGIAMGGRLETFAGLSGIGDLIVTCASVHSRNRRAGILIGKGYSMDEAMKEVNMVVEGVYSTKAAVALAQKYEVELPIISQVNEILFDGKDPASAVRDLMIRDPKIEISDTLWQ